MVEVHIPEDRVIIGIDNGKKGAICVLSEHNEIIFKTHMPMLGTTKKKYDVGAIAKILRQFNPKLVVLEKVFLMGGKTSKKAALSMGFCQGFLVGICETLNYPYVIVAPKEWQKSVFAGMEKMDTKTMSYLYAKRLCPTEDWRKSPKSVNPHDGLTDAYCMAMYGKMKFL